MNPELEYFFKRAVKMVEREIERRLAEKEESQDIFTLKLVRELLEEQVAANEDSDRPTRPVR